MRSAVARWFVFLTAAVFGAVIGLLAGGFVTDARGIGAGVSAVTTGLGGMIMGIGVLCVATVLGAIVARTSNAAIGLFMTGFTVACFAMRTTSMTDVIFDEASFRSVFLDGSIWWVFATASAIIVFRAGGPLPDMPYQDDDTFRSAFRIDVVLRMAVSGCFALPVLWFVMRNDLKGQAIGGAALAGVASAFAVRFIGQKRQAVLLFSMPILAVIVMQLFAASPADAASEWVRGTISPFARVMPADLVSGIFVGVAIGLGLSRSSSSDDHAEHARA
ncbi:MAG: hypothetical protein O2800_02775 [Planctomycetota bacterium]|nr:hypothetical protein [Planctomycetota bacterium]